MSGTGRDAQLFAEAIGERAGTSIPADAAQLFVEAIGQRSGTAVPAHAAQLFAEAIGQVRGGGNVARAAQLFVEVICGLPPYPPTFARERCFPLGWRNYPPRAGRPWSLC